MKEKKSPVLLELHEKPWDFFFSRNLFAFGGS